MISAAPLVLRLITDIAIAGGVYLIAHSVLWVVEGRPDSVEKRALSALSAFCRARSLKLTAATASCCFSLRASPL